MIRSKTLSITGTYTFTGKGTRAKEAFAQLRRRKSLLRFTSLPYMRNSPLFSLAAAVLLAACSADPEPTIGDPPPQTTTEGEVPDAPATEPQPQAPADDPGPPPVGCSVQKDGNGFFTKSSGKSNYVGFVPKAYDGTPTMLLVALHGCGDTAMNFAQWGAAPYSLRSTQKHLAISVDGASGGGNCWNVSADAPKVIAAIEDMSKCFYVHKQKVVIAGFSSGGMLAYGLGISQASLFAGILIENSNVPGGVDITKASWKINIAHRARTGDSAFPISGVRSTWTKLRSAGFPLETQELPGGHDGTTEDWAEWLIPKMQGWKAP